MSIRFVLDQHLRGPTWRAVQSHNSRGVDVIDVIRVGDLGSPPLGTSDPDLLLWCEGEGRILVSCDHNTLPPHLAAHLQSGHHSPGIFLIRRFSSLPQVVAFLVAATYASNPSEWQDLCTFIP